MPNRKVTFTSMSREVLQTVTDTLPIICPCKGHDATGFTVMGDLSFVGHVAKPVRAITPAVIQKAIGASKQGEHKNPLGVSREKWRALRGLMLLRFAREDRDSIAARRALEMMSGVNLFWTVPTEGSVGKALDYIRCRNEGIFSRAVDDTMKMGLVLAGLSTLLLEPVRVVLYAAGSIKNNQYVFSSSPVRWAIFCPDTFTAVAVNMLCDQIKMCPQCHKLFLGKSNQNYCSVQHREAYRVARWRGRKKQGINARKATKKAEKKGGIRDAEK